MIKRNFVLLGCLLFVHHVVIAQDKFFTKNGKIGFVSKGAIETIEAKHKSITCVLDSKTGDIQFAVLMKGFEFKKALMQEHFNENYVESSKYPRAEFKGQVLNNSAVDYNKDGAYKARVKGRLSIHGETKDVETDGTITVKSGTITLGSAFTILLSDYKISIPNIVKDNINDTVTITVDCTLEPLKS